METIIYRYGGLEVRKYSEDFIAANGENLGQPVLIRSIVQAGIWRSISEEQGIYHLFANGELVYVGVANNLQRRLREHYESAKLFDAYLLFPCNLLSMKTIYRIEAKMIEEYKPALNKTWN